MGNQQMTSQTMEPSNILVPNGENTRKYNNKTTTLMSKSFPAWNVAVQTTFSFGDHPPPVKSRSTWPQPRKELAGDWLMSSAKLEPSWLSGFEHYSI